MIAVHLLNCFPRRTGYANIRESSRKIFGDETIDRTCRVYGLDEEGELRGSYRPTGHPGVSLNTKEHIRSVSMTVHNFSSGLVRVTSGIRDSCRNNW